MIDSSSSLRVYRPLIYFQKKQILSELDFFGVTYDTDYTNLNSNYTIRNKLRFMISANSEKLFYYDAWDDFFIRFESQYRFPITIQRISIPDWCKREIIRLTKCSEDELLAFCKSYVPHLSHKHFVRILSLESGQKVELGD
jgi:tRNA(Ile)-lysidine synthase TilS/MesJ